MNWRMTSYADNFEDVLLQRAFALDSRGFYIDVGAYAPVEHSVTKQFYDRGWRGINVEPNPKPFADLRDARDRDVNLNIGLSDVAGELEILEAPGACWSVDERLLTGFFGASAADIRRHTIPVRTLAEVCDEHVPRDTPIDFLKVDVEGHERAVFAGGDWTRHRPRIIIAEALGYEAWESILLDAGYHFTLFEGINRVYVRDEDAHLIPLLNYPVNSTDAFLIYGYLRRINDQAATIDQLEDRVERFRHFEERFGHLGERSLLVADWVHRASRRLPRASRVARHLAGRLRRGA